jgi:hypothetical protein
MPIFVYAYQQTSGSKKGKISPLGRNTEGGEGIGEELHIGRVILVQAAE